MFAVEKTIRTWSENNLNCYFIALFAGCREVHRPFFHCNCVGVSSTRTEAELKIKAEAEQKIKAETEQQIKVEEQKIRAKAEKWIKSFQEKDEEEKQTLGAENL